MFKSIWDWVVQIFYDIGWTIWYIFYEFFDLLIETYQFLTDWKDDDGN